MHKLKSLAVTTIAAFAVGAVPAAALAQASPKHPRGHHDAKSHVRASRSASPSAAASDVFRAPFPTIPFRTPRYIYQPAAEPTSLPSTPTCMSSAESCLDVELCEYWGENCF